MEGFIMNKIENLKGYSLIHRRAFVLEKILLSEFLSKIDANVKTISENNSYDMERELETYYALKANLRVSLEKLLDKYSFGEVSYLETELSYKDDENSKRLSRVLELYLYTRLR